MKKLYRKGRKMSREQDRAKKKLEKNPRNQLKNIDTHGRIVKIWAEISMPGSSSEMNT